LQNNALRIGVPKKNCWAATQRPPSFITFHLAGPWRWIYVVCLVAALWFNVFIFIVQSFEKIPALHALAPTQSEPPFKIAQLVTLIIFIILGVFSVRKLHVAPAIA
jgi:hypothetical protein